jgi:hypothetical protein
VVDGVRWLPVLGKIGRFRVGVRDLRVWGAVVA